MAAEFHCNAIVITMCFNDLVKALFMFYGIHLYINQIGI